MSFFNQICGRLKLLFLAIIGIFRRALCCFSRRRCSISSDTEILQTISVVNNNYHTSHRTNEPTRDWNSWDDTPQTIEEHIEHYRQTLVKPPTPKQEEPEPDFFKDMTPQIQPQLKIIVDTSTSDNTDKTAIFSRLEAKTDIPIPIGADLEDWSEENPGEWEEVDNEHTKQLIREKRKELRLLKQNKLKDVKNNSSNRIIAERIKHNS